MPGPPLGSGYVGFGRRPGKLSGSLVKYCRYLYRRLDFRSVMAVTH
jgi:hypothetical protein